MAEQTLATQAEAVRYADQIGEGGWIKEWRRVWRWEMPVTSVKASPRTITLHGSWHSERSYAEHDRPASISHTFRGAYPIGIQMRLVGAPVDVGGES